MTLRPLLFCLLASASFLPLPALAQTDPGAMERMDRLEHDLQLLQRQVAQGGPATGGADTGAPITNSNQLEMRLTGIEDQIRELRGNVEQNQNEVRKLADNLDRFQKDTEFRLNQQPAAGAAAAPAPVGPPKIVSNIPGQQGAPVVAMQYKADAPQPPEADSLGEENKDPTRGDPSKKKVVPGELKSNFATPRDHYNYAFRLLNQTQYEQAAASFDDFVAKYPKDALVGNAYYWGGETYYIRRDYVKSADYFRQGYEAMPEGPKAADNLYKLALSLNALDRAKEGCVVLQEVVAKFKKTSTNIAAKAEQELKSSACRKG